ncbi:T6SS effector phospholipase Tle3 domain-containing protein [Paraburkholderia oxyphila]
MAGVDGVRCAGGLRECHAEDACHVCAGLNERLSRNDLRAGRYGEQFREAIKHKSDQKSFDRWANIKYDPDTYQFQRTGVTNGDRKTHSMLIPFYWGYRAASDKIRGGEEHPTTLRGQYQDIYGNRLDKHFAKGGGMFNNATTNIPEMYGPGFQQSLGNRGASMLGMSDYQYSATSPERTYYVLAAVRLAMLIREIRRFDPDETVTVTRCSEQGRERAEPRGESDLG